MNPTPEQIAAMEIDFYDFVYFRGPVVCLSHIRNGVNVGEATISNGLWGEQGLSCPICHGKARKAAATDGQV